ncbi:hypothetical protein BZL35_00394 [Candidatus Pandoraea novymonadis]|uniref:Uncharacterized protein n=1 Tax=Candidatus Pandoraea novymonadis TaxID=1808959 RepID=A0ABX5FEM6_9BURK|nr:hypothetical protein BZL35_00394 [Candidatus Pandoraea novymonadis]
MHPGGLLFSCAEQRINEHLSVLGTTEGQEITGCEFK